MALLLVAFLIKHLATTGPPVETARLYLPLSATGAVGPRSTPRPVEGDADDDRGDVGYPGVAQDERYPEEEPHDGYPRVEQDEGDGFDGYGEADEPATEPVIDIPTILPPSEDELALGHGAQLDVDTGAWEYLLATDEVSGLAIDEAANRLWTTGAGVTEWDLSTGDSRVYTLEDGLPGHRVGHPTLDADGTLWVGGRDGIGTAWLDADGRWQTDPSTAGPPEDVVTIALAPDDSLWFGTVDGASRRSRDGNWTHFGAYPFEGTVAGMVTKIAFDSKGNVWFATLWGGLSTLRADGTWSTEKHDDGSGVPADNLASLHVDGGDRLWVSWIDLETVPNITWNVAMRNTDGTWVPVDLNTPGLKSGAGTMVAIDADNRPWLRTKEGLFEPDGDGSWQLIGDGEGLGGHAMYDVALGEDGTVWVATDDGVRQRDADGAWHRFQRGGLPNRVVNDMAFATDGSAWIGTRAGLAARHPDGSWSQYGTADGLSFETIGGVVSDHRDGVWVSTLPGFSQPDLGGVHHIESDGTISHFRVPAGLGSSRVRDFLIDNDGTAYFATSTCFIALGQCSDGGLSVRRPDGRWSTVQRGSGIPGGGDIHALLLDEIGGLWLGSDIISGAPRSSLGYRQRTGRYVEIDVPASVEHAAVVSLARGPAGRIWVGFFDSVAIFDRAASAWTTVEDDPALAFRAESMALDAHGTMWFGTDNGLRLRTQDGQWSQLTAEDGLSLRTVTDVEVAPDGRIWATGDGGGISIFRP